MILSIISDIHGNLEALNRVLEKIDSDMILCCGDIVGYYSWPNECIEKIQRIKAISVIGNHDLACVTQNTDEFNLYAKKTIKWTMKVIKDKNLEFLKLLKPKIKLQVCNKDIMLVHGSPRSPMKEYIFPETPDSTFKSFIKNETVDILVMGHTHVPFVKKFGDKLVLNPGSIGQPRDKDKRASFAILDLSKGDAHICRVEYDINEVVDDLKRRNLPSFLGKRLYTGT